MINYNLERPINEWFNGSENVKKVYYNNRVVYHKVTNLNKIYLAHLTLSDGSIKHIEDDGTGVLSSGMTSAYKSNTISVTVTDNCTSIGTSAFNKCTSLTSVTIPNSVTSIGFDAFSTCSGLTSVTIPNSVTSIGAEAFNKCTSLTSVTIPDSVTSIGTYAFFNCEGLTEINVKGLVPATLDYGTFDESNECPIYTDCSVVDDYKSAWSEYESRIQCKGTPSYSGFCKLTLNTGEVVEIEGEGELTQEMVSAYSTTCVSAEIGNKCTNIGVNAFYYCTSLSSVTIGNSVTSIGQSAFDGCISLTSITIPDSVTSIGDYAFRECNSLSSVTIPNSVTSIGGSAFFSCDSLSSVAIPNSVTSIENQTFGYCPLTSVTIPNSVTSIGQSAFYSCTSLSSITIPDSVTSIGSQVFSSCSSLTSITSNATAAPAITRSTFQNVKSGGTLTVPTGSDYDTWMSTGSYYLGYYNWTKKEQ